MSTLLSTHRKPFLVLTLPLGVSFTSFTYPHSNVSMDSYLYLRPGVLKTFISFYNLEIKNLFWIFTTEANLKNWRGFSQTEIYFQNFYFLRGLEHHQHRIKIYKDKKPTTMIEIKDTPRKIFLVITTILRITLT